MSASSSGPLFAAGLVLVGKVVVSGPGGRDISNVRSSIWRICQGFGVALAWAGLLDKHNPWQNGSIRRLVRWLGRAGGTILEVLEGGLNLHSQSWRERDDEEGKNVVWGDS